MNQELEALGRRAVACEHWRWRQGMSLSDGTIVVRVSDNGRPVVSGGVGRGGNALSEVYPDLSDPATVGALLGLVREAWQEPCLSVICLSDTPDGQAWGVRSYGRAFDSYSLNGAEDGLTEAEALVCALEAAP